MNDGEKAIQVIDAADRDDAASCPSVMILDLNLPRKTGYEVLEHYRHRRRCGAGQVLIVTSSDSKQDRETPPGWGPMDISGSLPAMRLT